MVASGGVERESQDCAEALRAIIEIAKSHPSVVVRKGRGPDIKIPTHLRVVARNAESEFLRDWDIDDHAVFSGIRPKSRTFVDLVLECPFGGCDECLGQLDAAFRYILSEKIGGNEKRDLANSPEAT